MVTTQGDTALRAQLHRIFTAGPGEQGRRPLPLRTKFNYALWLTRPEIAPMSSSVMVADVLFSAHSGREIWNVPMLVASLILAAAIQLLHVANCLADRWVDMEYKSKFARMTRDLGVRFVAWQIYLTTAFILLGGVYLAVATRHWDLLALVPLGTFLLLQYSLPPWHFKSGGFWQIPWTYIACMVFPGLVVLRLYDRPIEIPALLAVLGMGLTLTGIFSVNTAEDVPEDAEHGINTSVLALGLPLSFAESMTRVTVGAALVTAGTVAVAGWTWTLVPYALVWLLVMYYLGTTLLGVRGKPLEEAMTVVRPRAKQFVIMVALMGWVTVFPAAAMFAAR
ncbi:1,4-dihydroxy-2-naphthoate octaprenyltransferase [Nocardia transvalensis]|uniref:1,4-dihydroxy-2-naphthoate octaprenyltransferase n=1 Tax=Nocardia transvalensis TaxID=37333 RepID=A0A7W9PHV1_9NOCA|nr:UbiA family prenyltransferase [Nocardia transvalensis]MBB5916362.1 1,4-dihydroxy-2-naphthoate octaprenyltransferase [Nocardia transvalensis]